MVTRPTKLKRITVPRRIMLFLYDNQKYIDRYEVPESVSQNGIAIELNLRQNNVSRALTELVSNGLIFSRSSHIRGIPRKRRVYFLTKKGVEDILDFIEEISSRTVLVHTTEGELMEYTLKEVSDEFRKHLGHQPSLHEIITTYYIDNEIDINYISHRHEMYLKKFKEINLPKDSHFYGRRKECEVIFETISDGHCKFIVINSIAGQGKTTLLVKIVSNIKNRPIFWTTLNEWVRPSDILNDWGYFLKKNKMTNLFNNLGTSSQLNIQDAIKAFIKDSKSLEPILVIDDFHKASPDIINMFRLLKTLITQKNKTVFLISSRERPKFYGKKDLIISNMVFEIVLEGLDKESAILILKKRNIPEPEFETTYELTKGHPLALELYTPTSFTDVKHQNLEFNIFLGEEVIQNLNELELKVVKLASIFSRPVLGRAFFFSHELNQEVLERLCDKLILKMYQNGTYDMHDLIKSYCVNRMTDFEKKKYINIACDYYSAGDSEKDMLDYIRLLKESKQKKRFIKALLQSGDFLLSQGYTQIGEYIQEIDSNEVMGLQKAQLLILKSDSALMRGKLAQARGILKFSLKQCDTLFRGTNKKVKKEKIIQLISCIYNRRAEISKLEGRMDETIKAYKKNMKLNRKYGNLADVGKALNNLGIAYRERGELDLALVNLFNAKKIFQELDDRTALALVEVNIGDIYFLKKDYNNSNKHFQEVEKITLKHPSIKGSIYRKLGQTKIQLGQFESAQSALLESSKAYKKVGNPANGIRALNDLFKCAQYLANRESSKEYLETASRLLDAYDKDQMNSELLAELVNEHLKNQLVYSIIWDNKNLEDRINRYVTFHSDRNDPKVILDDIELLSNEIRINKNTLLTLYSRIEEFFRTLEDKHPLIIINIRRAKLLQDLRRAKEGKTLLKRMLPLAKQINFHKAIRRIEEMLRRF